MSSPADLPTPAEQEREYRSRKATYDALYGRWVADGRLGPPPPRPVPPHTPGWNPTLSEER